MGSVSFADLVDEVKEDDMAPTTRASLIRENEDLKEQIKALNKENWATLDLTILKGEQLDELEEKLRGRIKEIREAKEACFDNAVNALCFEDSNDEGGGGNALEL